MSTSLFGELYYTFLELHCILFLQTWFAVFEKDVTIYSGLRPDSDFFA